MIVPSADLRVPPLVLAGAILWALGALLSGCADMSDGMTSAFADPAKYDLYNCKQLETERKNLTVRLAELQGLMTKAQSGVGGPVVAEVAYRNEYIAVRGQLKNANEAWAINKCRETPASKTADKSTDTPVPPLADKPGPGRAQRSGGATY
jgi:hypothetical protein